MAITTTEKIALIKEQMKIQQTMLGDFYLLLGTINESIEQITHTMETFSEDLVAAENQLEAENGQNDNTNGGEGNT